jgi:hypothetical protein
VERNRKAGQNPSRVVAPIEEEEQQQKEQEQQQQQQQQQQQEDIRNTKGLYTSNYFFILI